jgi:hypothetical protein
LLRRHHHHLLQIAQRADLRHTAAWPGRSGLGGRGHVAKGALLGALVFLAGSCKSTAMPGGAAGGPDASVSPDASPDAPANTAEVAADAATAPGDGAGEGGAGEVGPPDGGDAGSTIDTAGMCTAGQYGPFPGCVPPAGGTTCDPVCQSGCACGERCRLEGGKVACHAEGSTFVEQYASCDPKDDRCRPGTLCLQESPDQAACGAHCYRHCRADSDCPNARCSILVQFGGSSSTYKVCSTPVDACDPFGPARCSPAASRPSPTFGCYVLSDTYPDLPTCDCAGTVPLGQPCMFQRECAPGAECVLAGGLRTCRRVCKVGAPAGTALDLGGCPTASPTCLPFPGATLFGYCR